MLKVHKTPLRKGRRTYLKRRIYSHTLHYPFLLFNSLSCPASCPNNNPKPLNQFDEYASTSASASVAADRGSTGYGISLASVALTNLWGNEDQVQNYAAGRADGEQVEARPPEANGAQLTNKNETHQRK